MYKYKLSLFLFFCITISGCNFTRRWDHPTNKNVERKTMIIGFTGDVMIGRLVNEKIKNTSTEYPWGNMIPLLKENDLNIINLETTLTKRNLKITKVFNFKSDPEHVETLEKGHIDVVSLANNHSLDFSDEGLFETIKMLDSKNIKHVGAGTNENEARKAVIIKKKNIRIGILGYTDNEPGWKAEKNKPGINFIRVGDIETVKKNIAKIRNKVDILVATLHWGPNMRQKPTQKFIDFAHALIDNGVDIIHGHSAHIFQGIEIYKNKIIMYDTGNFIDDYMVTPSLRNDTSFLFRIYATKDSFEKIELIPVLISNMQVNTAPSKLALQILEKMKNLSAEFNTNVEIKNGQGIVKIK
jgi:poly-gamma-glutamate synthesis protein (capsule biosynthesis protein)